MSIFPTGVMLACDKVETKAIPKIVEMRSLVSPDNQSKFDQLYADFLDALSDAVVMEPEK